MDIKTVPGLILEPVPHLPLPPPFDAYCLTPWLDSDVQIAGQVLNHPDLVKMSGVGSYDEAAVRGWIKEVTKTGMILTDLHAIRLIKSLSDTVPAYLGSFLIRRESFRSLYVDPNDQKMVERAKMNEELPLEQAQWRLTCYIHPDHGGKGLMQAVGETALKSCPVLLSRPGMLSGGWLQDNDRSRRYQARLGFQAMGKVLNMWEGRDGIMALWMGGGEIEKKDSILAPMTDLTQLDLDRDESADEEYKRLKAILELILKPLPHLPLPPPFDDYCLTTWLDSDVEVAGKVMNHPDVVDTLGEGMKDRARLLKWMRQETGRGKLLLDLHAIRPIQSLSNDIPDYIGSFLLRRETFRIVHGSFTSAGAKREEENEKLPLEEAQYQMTFYIHPDHGRKGLMQAAGETALKHCPSLLHRPGMLSGGWLEGNGPSRRCQQRLGFKALGKYPNMWQGKAAIGALWMGGGEIQKKDSILAPMEDMSEHDLELIEREDEVWREGKRLQSGGLETTIS